MQDYLKGLARKWIDGRARSAHIVKIDKARDVFPYLYWIEERPIRFLMPVSMLRMQGAFAYGPNHPFVACLGSGPDALKEFYDRFQPADLAEMYGIEKAGLKGENLPPWELPWILREKRTPPPGEAGLGAEHGVSFYGPATPQKVVAEHQRLTRVRDGIKANGYRPDVHGDIEGHFMRSNDDVCFFVRGGKHRASALASLGFTSIPVRVRNTWPKMVDARDAEDWPLVASGQIDVVLARRILEIYIEGK